MSAAAVALRPVAAEDAGFLWHWTHGVANLKWNRWDAPYFHAADGPSPSRAAFDAYHLARRRGAAASGGRR